MHRFHLPPDACRGDVLTLPEPEAHHAAQVLRMRAGERAVVLDGAGQEILCDVLAIQRRLVTLAVKQRTQHPPLPCQITLIQAITRAKTMDLIVQKATELGAHRVVPILSERTVAQVDDEAASNKVDKWLATAIEAVKQCGSPWLPKIERPQSPAAFLGRGERFDLQLIASLQPGAEHPRRRFATFLGDRGRRPATVGVWVGPEGDLTPAEINAVCSAGALPITLGPLVLRSETAAIYCLSILSYEMMAPTLG